MVCLLVSHVFHALRWNGRDQRKHQYFTVRKEKQLQKERNYTSILSHMIIDCGFCLCSWVRLINHHPFHPCQCKKKKKNQTLWNGGTWFFQVPQPVLQWMFHCDLSTNVAEVLFCHVRSLNCGHTFKKDPNNSIRNTTSCWLSQNDLGSCCLSLYSSWESCFTCFPSCLCRLVLVSETNQQHFFSFQWYHHLCKLELLALSMCACLGWDR